MSRLMSFAPALVVWCAAAHAQTVWVPYMADYREVRSTVDLAGRIVHETVSSGTKSRASNGSELLMRVTGGSVTEVLTDGLTGNVYTLDRSAKRAVLTHAGPGPAEKRSPKDNPVATKVINGLLCNGYPMRRGGPKGDIVGTMWVSTQYDLEVKQEVALPKSDGSKLLWTVELSDFRSTEPPAEQIRIPADFAVVDNARVVPCPSCPKNGSAGVQQR